MTDSRRSIRPKQNRASSRSQDRVSRAKQSGPSVRHAMLEQSAKVTDLEVTEADELLKFLIRNLATKGRNKVKGLLARGQITVDNRVITKYDHNLLPGQRVSVHWARPDDAAIPGGLSILYEDDHLIVIDKPAGLLTVATENEKQRTAYHQLMDHVRKQNSKRRVFVVHRLDRDTSGVMLFAKSEAVQEKLQDNWKDAVLRRMYVVLVEGRVSKDSGTITSWLKENSAMKMFSSRTPNDGLKAITHYKVLDVGTDYSLLEVSLETGRKNQIRVHMQDIGHSVVGDYKYGSTKNPIGRLGLHAKVLSFRHPVTNEVMQFEADVPKKFRSALKSSAT